MGYLFFLRLVSLRAGLLISFFKQLFVSAQCFQYASCMSACSGLVVQGKAFPVGQVLCSILRAAPALLQGLVPAEGSGLGVLEQDPSGERALSVHNYG